jgi:hypothetical protein
MKRGRSDLTSSPFSPETSRVQAHHVKRLRRTKSLSSERANDAQGNEGGEQEAAFVHKVNQKSAGHVLSRGETGDSS